jgi:sugar phosphate isomerase/epimerase
MNLSIGTTFNYNIPLKEQLPMIKAAGFTHISLGGGDLEHSRYLNASGQKNLKSLLAEYDLRVCSVHAPFRSNVDISSSDPVPAKAALALLKKCVDAAEILGAGTVIFHPDPDPAGNPERRKEVLANQVVKLIDHIGPRDIKLAAENLRSEIVNEILCHTLDMIPDPKYGLCFDTSHDNLISRPMGLLLMYGPRMVTTHISDNRGEKDDHLLPFEGVIDWNKFCGIFARIKYPGPFLLEVEMRESAFKDPREFLREAFTRGEKLLGLAGKGAG